MGAKKSFTGHQGRSDISGTLDRHDFYLEDQNQDNNKVGVEVSVTGGGGGTQSQEDEEEEWTGGMFAAAGKSGTKGGIVMTRTVEQL